MAALPTVVTSREFSIINFLLAKRRPPPRQSTTDMPSLWEDGALDRLTARLAAFAARKTRRTGIAIQG
jgi:hypothetical protein